MKYFCEDCKKEFNEPESNKEIKSLLVRFIKFKICPNCGSSNTDLTKIYKLRIERKFKINQIYKNE